MIFAQTQVTGVVKSNKGVALSNVSIVVPGTPGVVSDANGNYSLPVVKNVKPITFSLVGYVTQIVAIDGWNVIDITLLTDVKALDDVVVIGYGTVNKKDVTGSVSTIKPNDFKNQLITNSSDILKGRVAGVSITEASGTPDGDFKIRIRGVNSILGGNDPLIVVDGIQGDISLQDINPYDIKSMDQLVKGLNQI